MLKSNSLLTAAIGILLTLYSSVSLMAAENIELTSKDVKTNLQVFRNDGKYTLALLRYHGCGPCDKAEVNMQKWYQQADQQNVSVLIINIDDQDRHEAVYARQSKAGINLTSLFANSSSGVSNAVEAITGNRFAAVPLFIFFGPDGEFIADRMGDRVDWKKLNKLIANR